MFQRLMDQVTAGFEFTAAYLDNLIIYSTMWEEHVDHLRQIFTRLHEASLTVKPKKCQLGTNHNLPTNKPSLSTGMGIQRVYHLRCKLCLRELTQLL